MNEIGSVAAEIRVLKQLIEAERLCRDAMWIAAEAHRELSRVYGQRHGLPSQAEEERQHGLAEKAMIAGAEAHQRAIDAFNCMEALCFPAE